MSDLELIITLILVYFLNYLFEIKNVFKKVVSDLENIINDCRWILVFVPGVIGFLPMLGGALMSAPIVEEVGKKANISPEDKTFLNYWFRHIWEYILPIYPTVLVTANVLHIPVMQIIKNNFILTISMVLTGMLFGFTKIKHIPACSTGQNKFSSFIDFLSNLSPILLATLLIVFFKANAVLSLGLSIALFIILNKVPVSDILKFRLKGKYDQILLVIIILVFKNILLATKFIDKLPLIFQGMGWAGSKYVILFLLPFSIGASTGLGVAIGGISFSVLSPIIGNDLKLMTFGFMSGYAGLLLSPAHFCLNLTQGYFKPKWRKLYAKLIPPTIIMILIALVYSL